MNDTALKFLLLALLVAALVAMTGGASFAVAQGTRIAPPGSRPVTERAAVDLKHGMTPDEVRQLLGKPWRTTMSGNGGIAGAQWQGTLRWIYSWNASSSGSERNLNVDFSATGAEQWTVSGWSWSGY